MYLIGSFLGALITSWLFYLIVDFLFKKIFKKYYYEELNNSSRVVYSFLIATSLLVILTLVGFYNSESETNFKDLSLAAVNDSNLFLFFNFCFKKR